MARKKLLIIKHGFSETCDHRVSPVVSLGDVFRCTCLLEDFRAYEVTWITAVAAADLLLGNHLIDKLILADSSEDLPAEGVGERFHTIINLEKQEDWCRFAVSLDAKRRYGFRDWTGGCRSGLYHLSGSALSGTLDNENYQPVQTTLFSIVGKEWAGQRYVLGYRPKVAEVYDVGLNYHIGPKWPTKAWSQDKWQQLYRQLSQDRAVAWQQSLNSIRHYIDWLASCRLIVTCDSLGLHLALGLKKRWWHCSVPRRPSRFTCTARD